MILPYNLEQLPELIEIEKWLETHEHNFLKSILEASKEYKLTPNQIKYGKSVWAGVLNPPKYINISQKEAEIWELVFYNYLPRNYYNQMNVVKDLIYSAKKKGKLTENQYNVIFKAMYKYKRAILKGIFNV